MPKTNELFQQGMTFFEKKQYDDSLKVFEQIMLSDSLVSFLNQKEQFEINYCIAYCRQEMNQTEEAIKYFKNALDIAIELPQSADKQLYIADIYTNFGVYATNKKKYDEAIQWYEKVANFYQKQGYLQYYNILINNIGEVYQKQFQLHKAIPIFKKAIATQKELLLQKETSIVVSHDIELYLANNYNNLGSILGLQGDYESQIFYLKKALTVALKHKHTKYIAYFYNNIIIAYEWLKKYDEHLETCLVYVKFCKQKKEPNSNNKQLSKSYYFLHKAYFNKKDYPKALETLNRAEKHCKQQDLNHRIIIVANFTLIYLAQNQLQKAEQYLSKAVRLIEIDKEWINESTITVVSSIYAKLLTIQKDYEQAFKKYTDVLASLSKEKRNEITVLEITQSYPRSTFLGYDLIKTLKTLSAILDLYAQHYKELSKVSINQILAYCRKSIDLIDHLRKTYSAERSKLILAEKAALIYDNTITILYRLYQETKEPILLEVIFECMEKSKAMVLLGTMQDNTAKQQSDIPQSALKEEQRLRKRLTAYENALQKENTKKVKNEETIRELESGHFDANEEYKKLIERFEQDYPNYHQLKYAIKTTAVEHLQQTITVTTALVSYFVGKYHLTIFVVTKDEIYCEQLPIERKKLLSENGRKGLVKDFQKAINKSVYSRDVEQCAVYTQNAFACFDYLLAPIMDKLPENITTLRIIPDVVLGSIPFEALVTKMPNQDINSTYNQLRYLAHDYAIAYHYSATLWHYQQVQKSKTLVSQSSKQSKRFTGKYTAFVPSYEGTRYGNLSYTLTEAKSIGTMLADKNAMEQQFFVGENATKAAFEANCQESQVIVFAGHGNYNTKQPSKSGLIFTPIQRGKEDAEVLKLSEVYNLQLKANVVLLSACKSGKGDLAIGEGVMGVNRGFLYAGAKNVLFTLFNVPDESASELSTAFFRAVIEQPSLNYAKALQTAKKQLLSNSNYTPKHWSGLVLIGE